MTHGSGRSGWFYVGAGCAGLAALLLVGLAALVFIGLRSVRQFKKDARDPAARTVRAQRLLGARELPQGYHAGASFSLPLVLDMTMLVDRPPEPDGDVSRETEHLFVYVKLLRGGGDWEAFVAGRADPMELLDDQGFRFDSRGLVGRNEFQLDDARVIHTGQRGRLATGSGRHVDGLVSFMVVICPEDRRKRIGVWAGPDPAPDRPLAQVDLDGTVADPRAIRAFLYHFDLCGS